MPDASIIPARIATPALLVIANVFMTYAWYGHLKDAKAAPLWAAVLMSWGVAFLEYCVQVPANRIGFGEGGYSLQQLKVMQEVITMVVFAGFAAASASCARRISSLAAKSSPKRTSRRLLAMTKTYAAAW